MTGHIYWRVELTGAPPPQHDGTDPKNFVLAEVGLLISGVNVAPGSGGTASADQNTNNARYLFDGLNTTYWSSSDITLLQSIGYQFPTAQAITGFSLTNGPLFFQRAPTSATLQSSDDGVTWTTVLSGFVSWPNSQETVTFTAPASGTESGFITTGLFGFTQAAAGSTKAKITGAQTLFRFSMAGVAKDSPAAGEKGSIVQTLPGFTQAIVGQDSPGPQPHGVYFYGFDALIGKMISVFVNGTDVGDYLVDTNGRVFVPYTATFTNAGPFTPAVGGFTYTSQGQMLRPIAPQEAGSQTGPALGMTRRGHMFAALLKDTQGISFGTDFTNLHSEVFASPGSQVLLASNVLYSGVLWSELDDDYSFNSQLCWQITRPYPANVLAMGGFMHTQDR
jgi:hypothetical protein